MGDFDVTDAVAVDDVVETALLTPAAAAARVLDPLSVSAEEARDLRHGKRLMGQADRLTGSLAAAIDEEGVLVGVVERRGADPRAP